MNDAKAKSQLKEINDAWDCTPTDLQLPQPAVWSRRMLEVLAKISGSCGRAVAERLITDQHRRRTSVPVTAHFGTLQEQDLEAVLAAISSSQQPTTAKDTTDDAGASENTANAETQDTDVQQTAAQPRPQDDQQTLGRNIMESVALGYQPRPESNESEAPPQDAMIEDELDYQEGDRSVDSEDGGHRRADETEELEYNSASDESMRDHSPASQDENAITQRAGILNPSNLATTCHLPCFADVPGPMRPFTINRTFIVDRVVRLFGGSGPIRDKILRNICDQESGYDGAFLTELGPLITETARERVFREVELYCQHQNVDISPETEENTPVPGLYHSLYQQYIRQDPLIYALMVAIQVDCEFKLVSLPEKIWYSDYKPEMTIKTGIRLVPQQRAMTVNVAMFTSPDGSWRMLKSPVRYVRAGDVSFQCNPSVDEVRRWNREVLHPTYNVDGEPIQADHGPGTLLIPYSNIGLALMGFTSWMAGPVQQDLSRLFNPDLEVAKRYVDMVRSDGRRKWQSLYMDSMMD